MFSSGWSTCPFQGHQSATVFASIALALYDMMMHRPVSVCNIITSPPLRFAMATQSSSSSSLHSVSRIFSPLLSCLNFHHCHGAMYFDLGSLLVMSLSARYSSRILYMSPYLACVRELPSSCAISDFFGFFIFFMLLCACTYNVHHHHPNPSL